MNMRSVTILFAVIMLCSSVLQAGLISNSADINKDKKVNMGDFADFYAAWLSDDSPTANWNRLCDISDPNDGVINEQDLSVLAVNWLWNWTPPDPNQFAYIPSGEFEMGDYSFPASEILFSVDSRAYVSELQAFPEGEE